MKFKLDECMDVRLSALFADAGHDAQTVHAEGLSGEPDEKVYSVCIREGRILLTQDMAFANPFVFSPVPTSGIIVIRNPSQLFSEAKVLVQQAIMKLMEENPEARLWVVDRGGIRVWPVK